MLRHTGRAVGALWILALASACGDGPTGTVRPPEPPPTSFTRDDLTAEGNVAQTSDGYTVQGTLRVDNGEQQITFVNADLRVRFDDSNRVTSISGKAEIPSPHERIEFADPIRADVGLFHGKFLNEQRDLGIALKDDTDYFVFDFELALEMRIATGATGPDATKPVKVRAPLGGRILMVIDYKDPMYYVYGAQDLIGAAGIGWSLNGRIPFAPTHAFNGLGVFDGQNTRTGTFPVMKIVSVTGQMVDNEYTEFHLTESDPFASGLRQGYQAGFNGEMALDLFLGDILGIEIPIAAGSGGVWGEVSTETGFAGHAYLSGETASNASWWPAFIPVRPIATLDVESFIESDGNFEVSLAGEYGWELMAGNTRTMGGSFQLAPDAMTLTGTLRDGDVTLEIIGRVMSDATTVSVTPPPQLLAAIASSVNEELGSAIEDAQNAWEDLQKATQDYEFELSLRGLRSSIPAIVDAARQALANGITAELANHEGEPYHSQLRTHLLSADDAYYAQLDRLKAAALEIQDNDQTRQNIESALRTVAGMKFFRTTFQYRVLGIVVATVNVDRRIMSDVNATRLIEAADNVKHIKETSDLKISAQQIYDAVPDREIFEQIRDDIQNGVIVMAPIEQLGFTYGHTSKSLSVFAVIGGQRKELGSIDAFSVAALAAALPEAMITVLRSN